MFLLFRQDKRVERVGTDPSRSQDQFHSSSLGDLAVKRKLPEKPGNNYVFPFLDEPVIFSLYNLQLDVVPYRVAIFII